MIPRSPSKRRCSRSAGLASTRRSCSPTSSSSPTRSAKAVEFRMRRRSAPRPDWRRRRPSAKLRREPDSESAGAGVRDSRPPQDGLCRRCGADWLLRRAMDGRELHDRRAWHARSGAGAPLRLPPSGSVRSPDRPAGRRLRGISASSDWPPARKRCRSSILGRACCRRPNSIAGAWRRSPRSRPRYAPRRRTRRSSPFPAAPGRNWRNSPALAGSTRSASTRRSRRAAIAACPSGSRCRAISIRWRSRRRLAPRSGDRPRPRGLHGPRRISSISATASCPRRPSTTSSGSSRGFAATAAR